MLASHSKAYSWHILQHTGWALRRTVRAIASIPLTNQTFCRGRLWNINIFGINYDYSWICLLYLVCYWQMVGLGAGDGLPCASKSAFTNKSINTWWVGSENVLILGKFWMHFNRLNHAVKAWTLWVCFCLVFEIYFIMSNGKSIKHQLS